MNRDTQYVLGVRSNMYAEQLRERRNTILAKSVLYVSLVLNAYLAIALAKCRMGL